VTKEHRRARNRKQEQSRWGGKELDPKMTTETQNYAKHLQDTLLKSRSHCNSYLWGLVFETSRVRAFTFELLHVPYPNDKYILNISFHQFWAHWKVFVHVVVTTGIYRFWSTFSCMQSDLVKVFVKEHAHSHGKCVCVFVYALLSGCVRKRLTGRESVFSSPWLV